MSTTHICETQNHQRISICMTPLVEKQIVKFLSLSHPSSKKNVFIAKPGLEYFILDHCIFNHHGNNKKFRSLISEKRQKIHTIIKTKALTINGIEKFSLHCPQYLIPYNQGRCKRYALILYNLIQRSGGEAEADYLEAALREAGCDVIKLEWQDTAELHNLIESVLSPISKSCSLLIVCLLSHGSRASVIGSQAKAKPVNEILNQLKHLLSEFTPLVRKVYIHVKYLFPGNAQVQVVGIDKQYWYSSTTITSTLSNPAANSGVRINIMVHFSKLQALLASVLIHSSKLTLVEATSTGYIILCNLCSQVTALGR